MRRNDNKAFENLRVTSLKCRYIHKISRRLHLINKRISKHSWKNHARYVNKCECFRFSYMPEYYIILIGHSILIVRDSTDILAAHENIIVFMYTLFSTHMNVLQVNFDIHLGILQWKPKQTNQSVWECRIPINIQDICTNTDTFILKIWFAKPQQAVDWLAWMIYERETISSISYIWNINCHIGDLTVTFHPNCHYKKFNIFSSLRQFVRVFCFLFLSIRENFRFFFSSIMDILSAFFLCYSLNISISSLWHFRSKYQ